MTLKAAKIPAPRTGGRPSARQAAELRGLILDTAREMFFTQGYGATSIDAIAKKAGISKRTFYHRFENKAALFGAVVQQMMDRLTATHHAPFSTSRGCEVILLQFAQAILKAALLPDSLALHRLMLAEATRFPELASMMNANGVRREAIRRIADLLQHHQPCWRAHAEFAAEQFLHMVMDIPQRRALGLGEKMNAKELEDWAKSTVSLFLHGYLKKSDSPHE